MATASARIGTILVVAPRQANFRYQFAGDTLTNTGNATLRIIAYGPCLKIADGKECKENYYLMPGKSRRFTRVNIADKRTGRALAGRAVCSREIDMCADGLRLCLYDGSPRTERAACLRHGSLLAPYSDSMAAERVQQIGGVIIPQAFSRFAGRHEHSSVYSS